MMVAAKGKAVDKGMSRVKKAMDQGILYHSFL
jgi:hypothetical protein